jgi:hypothetical protein
VGQLVESDDATLTIFRDDRGLVGWPFRRRNGDTLKLPRESVLRLERSMRPSRKKLGGLIGGLVGFAAGVVVIERARVGEDHGWCQGYGLVAGVIAVPFAMIGGAVAPGDRWAVEDPKKGRVGFTRTPGGGTGFRLAVSF